eukprot:4307386-Amphidinium_carterae.1
MSSEKGRLQVLSAIAGSRLWQAAESWSEVPASCWAKLQAEHRSIMLAAIGWQWHKSDEAASPPTTSELESRLEVCGVREKLSRCRVRWCIKVATSSCESLKENFLEERE